MNTKERLNRLQQDINMLADNKATAYSVKKLEKRIGELEKKNLSLDLTKADNKLFGRLRNRIEALENHFVKPNKMIDPLESVKKQVTELLQLQGYVSVGDDGEIWCHDVEPKTLTYNWYSAECSRYVASMNLNGADWTKCLWKISDLLADSDVKKNFTTENSEQPDWENLLNYADLRRACDFYGTWDNQAKYLNQLIHERIKPLLSRIAELEADKVREFGIGFNEGRLHRKANQIDVPFTLDDKNDIEFMTDNILNNELYDYCRYNNIDQTKIERITLTMSEEE